MPITYDDPGTLYDETDITYDGALVGLGGTGVTSVLQIVDPDNLTTVLYDLNDQTGVNSQLYGNVATYLITDMDLGVPALKDTGISDVAKPLAFNRQATAPMKLRIRIKPASNSYDDLVLAVTRLANHLADGCVMRWQPTGAASVRYIDVLPSVTPVLLNGQESALFDALIQVDTPQGVTLSMERLAYTRGDALVASVNLLQNSTPGRDSNTDGTPDNWTILSTPTLTLDATQNSCHVVAGAASRGLFQDTAAASVAVGNTVTFSADVKVTSGTGALTIDWRTSGGASISTVSQTFTNTRFSRIYVTGVAPSTTDHVRATIQSSGGASTFDWRYAQCETGTTGPPTAYRVRAQTLANDPTTSGFAQLISVYNPCDASVPCQFEVSSPDATPKIVEADFALVSDRNVPGARNLYDFLNGPNYAQCEASTNGWTRTLGTNTTSTADGFASAGNTAQYAPTTDALAAIQTQIVRLTRTTLLDSMRGRWKVYARVKGSGAVEYNLQLNWGAGAVAGESNDAVTHDCTDVSSFHYVYVDLGDIELPREKNVTIGQLTLELYEWQSTNDDGSASTKSNFYADHLVFVATDDSAFVTIPGESGFVYRGKDLVTPKQVGAPLSDPAWSAGNPKAGAMRLDANNEGAAVGDSTNGSYTGTASSVHQVDFDLKIHTNSGASNSIELYAQVVDFTSATAASSIHSIDQSGYSPSVHWSSTVTDSAHPFQARVVVTSVSGTAHVDVNQITINQVPYVGQNARIRSDPGSQPSRAVVEQLDSSGNLGLECDATGVPFWLPPGLSLVYVSLFDVANSGYDENQAVLARTFTVTPTLYPRYWG